MCAIHRIHCITSLERMKTLEKRLCRRMRIKVDQKKGDVEEIRSRHADDMTNEHVRKTPFFFFDTL